MIGDRLLTLYNSITFSARTTFLFADTFEQVHEGNCYCIDKYPVGVLRRDSIWSEAPPLPERKLRPFEKLNEFII